MATTRASAESVDRQTQCKRNSLERDLVLQGRLDASPHPVLTLPNEIVSEVFVHFLPIYPETPPMIGRSSPNVLGHICKKWREIALGTPALWRGITLSLSNGKRFDQKIRLLRLWLQRSGSCLLSIHMDLDLEVDMPSRGGDADTNPAATIDLFTHAIAAHCARWEYLQLYSPTRPFPSVTGPLPFLRALTMGSVKPLVNGTPNADSLTQALHAAPLLRDVAVVFWREHCISLYPWSQLTAFTAHSVLPHLCADILACAYNLTYCSMFVYARSADEVIQTSQNVTHRNLSSLILRGYLPRHMSWQFLDIFTLPALRKFEIEEMLLQGDPIGRLKSFLSRSRCSLQGLYLNRTTVDVESYRVALPTVGPIINGELDPVNPWAVPRDEENESRRIADGDSTQMQMQA